MRKLLNAVLIAIFALSVQAQYETEEGLEYLLFMEIPEVITSTLTTSNVIQAPSTMTVISKAEIENMGLKNLVQLMQKVIGITVVRSRFGEYVTSLRGTFEGDKYKLLINGHAIADPVWGSFTDWYNVSLENVKQVEIIRGPGSSLYGTNAFAGIINVITYSPESGERNSVVVKAGSFNEQEGNVLASINNESYALSLNLNYKKSDGVSEKINQDSLSVFTPFSIAPGDLREGIDRTQADLQFVKGNFSIYASYMMLEEEIPLTQLAAITQDGEDKFWDYWYVDAQYTIDISSEMNIKAKLTYDNASFEDEFQALPNGFAFPFDIDGDGDIEFFPTGPRGEFGFDSNKLKGELILDYEINDSNRLIFGLFAEKEEVTDTFIKSNAHPVYFFNVNQVLDFSDIANWHKEGDRDIWGAFFQNEMDITDSLYFIIGGRFDDYSDFGSTFNPRTGLVWNYNDKGGVLKLLYGEAFKAPTFSQLRNQNNPSLIGDPDLDAEKLQSLELSLSYIFAEKTHLNLTVFSIDTEDLIRVSTDRDFTQPGAPLFFVNAGEEEVSGFEFDIRHVFETNSYFYIGVTHTDVDEDQLNKTFPFVSPEMTGRAGFNIQLKNGITWNINAEYIDELKRESLDPRDDLDSTVTVDSTLRINNVADKFDLFLSVYNIFDEELYSPSPLGDFPASDLPKAGVNYTAGLKVRF